MNWVWKRQTLQIYDCSLIPEPFIFKSGARRDEWIGGAWSWVNEDLISFHWKHPWTVGFLLPQIRAHPRGFLNMLYNRWLQPWSSIAYALIMPSAIAGLLFHTIWDFLKAFGCVSALRNSTTNHFFCRLALSVRVTQNFCDLFHASRRRCGTLVIQGELHLRCIQRCFKRKRNRGRRRAGRTWKRKWISSLFF